ncbi:hypothetical protein C0992_001692 [Termitomyces sp. T32_za158]|nr:hypothetical protein C0992_001692 [Termitomyces sp. T32_za158]
MEESDAEPGTVFTSPPLIIPPPNVLGAPTPQGPLPWQQDEEGDMTMVDTPPPSPTPIGGQLDTLPYLSHVGQRRASDPAWIIRRTRIDASPNSLTPLRSPIPMEMPDPSQPLPNATLAGGTPPRLPAGLMRFPVPARGFPVIHLSTPPWYNLRLEQRAHFDTYLEPKLWVRSWQGSKMDDLVAVSENLKSLIGKMTGERAKLSSPQQEKMLASSNRYERQKPSYHFLVTGILERAYRVITKNPIISTTEATAFFLPYPPTVPRFLCTIEGLTLSAKDKASILESEEEATCIVRETLLADDSFAVLLKSKLLGDTTSQHNLEPATTIISLIEVHFSKPEVLVNAPRKSIVRKPLWNLYFRHHPQITWPSYFVLLQSIRNISFADMDYGCTALVSEERRLHCFNCKEADHEHYNCAYSELKGWLANDDKEIEETAELAVSSKRSQDKQGET